MWKFPNLRWLYIEVSSAFWDHLQGQTMAGQPDKIEDLGETHIPQEIFTEYLFDLMPQFSYVPLFSSPSSFLFLLHSFPSFPLSLSSILSFSSSSASSSTSTTTEFTNMSAFKVKSICNVHYWKHFSFKLFGNLTV